MLDKLGFLWMDDSNVSQNVVQDVGSPLNFLRFNFGSFTVGVVELVEVLTVGFEGSICVLMSSGLLLLWVTGLPSDAGSGELVGVVSLGSAFTLTTGGAGLSYSSNVICI
jgi:hypothetical protein